MDNKIIIDNQLAVTQRGVYGIFIVSCNETEEHCAYIGKSEELSTRVKNHRISIQNKTHISSLNNVMDDTDTRIEIRLVEAVPYVFDNYYKDAQRLASRENFWIDKYQSIDQCLEQVPEGNRPKITRWEQLKAESKK